MLRSAFIEDCRLVESLARERKRLMLREPAGLFPLPYLVPGSCYSRTLWDWDALFLGIAMGESEFAPYMEGAMRTLLHFQQQGGFVPHGVSARPPHCARPGEVTGAKPLLAQGLLISQRLQGKRIEEQDWAEDAYRRWKGYYSYVSLNLTTSHGLTTRVNHRGVGTDNIPTVYGRPPHSTAPLFQNCLFFRELKAAALIADALGHPRDAEEYRSRADMLAEAINTHAWDPIDGLYYDQDVQSKTPDRVNQEVTWTLPLKIRSWTCFLPIWAGISPADRTQRMIDEHLLDTASFWSDYGVRTLSKLEPLFNNSVVGKPGNPSNWQGPIWGVSNYLIFRCLMDAGRRAEAEILAERTAALFARDIRRSGTLHEFYHTETGEPLCNPDFLNWNLLVLAMRRELETDTDGTAFGEN